MSGPAGSAPSWFREVTERFTGLELLFDLIFVFCVSQLTRTFREDPSWAAAGTALLVFVPVWWAWTGVTFATDRFPSDDAPTRLLVIGAAVATAVMALAIPAVPGRGETAFGLGYGAVRLLIAAFYLRARRAGPDGGRLARFYASGFGLVGAVWVVVAVLPLPLPVRIVLWGAALAVDVALPRLAGRRGRLLPVDGSHLAERCAAFVIIVIGETILETLSLSTEEPASAGGVAVLVGAGVLSLALWWGYFDRGSWRRRYEALEGERSGRAAVTICSYLHFPLVAGIAAAAAGVQLAVEHPDDPVGVAAAAALCAGCAAYLLSMNAMTWVLHVPRTQSLALQRLALVGALIVVLVVGSGWRPVLFVGSAALLLTLHAVIGHRRVRGDLRGVARADERQQPS